MTDIQIQHEISMARAGTEKRRRDLLNLQQKNYASKSEFGQKFIKTLVIPFAEALLKNTGRPARGKATRTAISMGYADMQRVFSFIHPNLVSYISLTTLIDQFYVAEFFLPKPQEASRKIGYNIEDELRVQYFTELAPDAVVGAVRKELNTPGSNQRNRSTGARNVAEKLLVNVYGWSKEDLFINWNSSNRFNVGNFVLETAAGLNLIEYFPIQIPNSKRKRGCYRLSKEVQAMATICQVDIEERTVLRKPLRAIPKDWELQPGPARENITGGYYQEWIKRDLNLCRGYTSDSEFGSEAINLLNTLGHTAWNIDSYIYETAKDFMEKGKGLKSFNTVFYDQMIDAKMPQYIVDKGKHDPEFKEWKDTKHVIIEKHRQSVNKASSSRLALSLAQEYLNKPRFYLSWSCDYRGRMYSQQSFLDQQKSDFQKSLVKFADGCRLDAKGEYYAATAIGSAFKGSRSSYEERSKWTYENDLIIKAIAERPHDMYSYLEDADEPWQFLQLCMEWTKVVLNKDKPLWEVPIGADATASGLQLLSAMRRDQKGMEFTNLFAPKDSNDLPRDAYEEVLRVARQMVYRDPETSWMTKYLEDRKLGKIILMKKVYGATRRTNEREVKEHFIDIGKYNKEINWESVVLITKVLQKASRKVFPMAFNALDTIKKLCRQSRKNGNTSFKWTTPNLDTIHLNEVDYLKERVESSFVGKMTIPLDEVRNPNYTKMVAAIAPSFVHSYDAALLKSAFQDWNHPLALIHDSFKVLPNDMDRAKERIRRAFIFVCSGDPLARLADDLGVTPDQIPLLEQGSGDLEDVRNSIYMFN